MALAAAATPLRAPERRAGTCRRRASVLGVSVPAWNAYDEGYLRAYQWASALAGGAALPQEASPVQLGPGEVAHARFAPVGVAGYFGENKEYRSGFLLVGGPVGLVLTGAASMARNSAKKAEAQRAAIPKWHPLGPADVVVTNQRLMMSAQGQTGAKRACATSPGPSCTGTASCGSAAPPASAPAHWYALR